MYTLRVKKTFNLFKHTPLKTYVNAIEKLFDKKKVQEFKENGYVVLPKVYSSTFIDELKAEVGKIVDSVDPVELQSTFDADHETSDKYFLESGDKVYIK